MKTLRITQLLWVILFLISISACNNAAKSETEQKATFIDIAQARKEIEAIDTQFTEDFKNKDSVALANQYASDGTLGSVKGKDNLVSTWNKMIKNAFDNETPNLLFETNAFSSDDEFVVELGSYRFVDNDGNTKSHGKYVVVWKRENGEWKIYRDVGL